MKNVNAMASVKRFMAVFMTLVLLAGLLPVQVLAAEPVTDEYTFQTAVSEGGTVKIDSSVDELEVYNINVSKDTTIVLNEQTLIGGFHVKPDVTLTIKGKGSLKGDDCLFTGRGTVVIDLDGETLKVYHTPGHTWGSVCILSEKSKVVFTGDTIFDTDLGRTDLEDGSPKAMEESCRDVINKWSNEYTIYPGHDESASMKIVRQYNQEFLSCL